MKYGIHDPSEVYIVYDIYFVRCDLDFIDLKNHAHIHVL